MIVNNGHGSTQSWAHEGIFYTDDNPNVSNDQGLPVMVMMTCHNDYFMVSGVKSLTEDILPADSDGAVAAFA
jgi:hypothetical protein